MYMYTDVLAIDVHLYRCMGHVNVVCRFISDAIVQGCYGMKYPAEEPLKEALVVLSIITTFNIGI